LEKHSTLTELHILKSGLISVRAEMTAVQSEQRRPLFKTLFGGSWGNALTEPGTYCCVSAAPGGWAKFYPTLSSGRLHCSGQAVGGQNTALETQMKGRGREKMLASELDTHLSRDKLCEILIKKSEID